MIILLVIWFLFLFVYIIYNIYGLFRMMQMRIRGDATMLMISIYLILIFVIIAASILLVSQLNWQTNFDLLNF